LGGHNVRLHDTGIKDFHYKKQRTVPNAVKARQTRARRSGETGFLGIESGNRSAL